MYYFKKIVYMLIITTIESRAKKIYSKIRKEKQKYTNEVNGILKKS